MADLPVCVMNGAGQCRQAAGKVVLLAEDLTAQHVDLLASEAEARKIANEAGREWGCEVEGPAGDPLTSRVLSRSILKHRTPARVAITPGERLHCGRRGI